MKSKVEAVAVSRLPDGKTSVCVYRSNSRFPTLHKNPTERSVSRIAHLVFREDDKFRITIIPSFCVFGWMATLKTA